MTCSRCGGLMLRTTLLDLDDDKVFADAVKCANCGNVEDRLILQHRRRNAAITQLVADAEAHLQLCSRSVADVTR